MCERLEPLFMGQRLSKHLLEQLKDEIVLYYRDHNRPVVSVYVPEQEVKNGVIQIVVIEGCVGQICPSGNCYFGDWIFESKLGVSPGSPIRADSLLTGVSYLNRNPFRSVDVVLTPGVDPYSTNIELVVSDRLPIQVYVGADNTGTNPSGTGRLFAGATWGNAFFLDHIATYQYTASPDFSEFQSHSGSYIIPLPCYQQLHLFGGYSTVKPNIDDFDADGSTSQASIRWTWPWLCNYNGRLNEWTLGFDFKNFNNNLVFVGDQELAVIAQTVNISQFVLGYAFAYDCSWQRFHFNLDLFYSPCKLLPNQSDERYNELSPHAKVRYFYGRLTVGDLFTLPGCWSISTLGRLQGTTQTLLPSEQFGLGGYDTVRGYKERELLVDDALVLNLELRTPPFGPISYFTDCCVEDEMIFLAFYDYGLGALNNRHLPGGNPFIGPTIGKTEYLMSVGVGWRYTICQYLSARVDWGVRLHKSVFTSKERSRFHAGVILSF